MGVRESHKTGCLYALRLFAGDQLIVAASFLYTHMQRTAGRGD